MVKTMNKDDVLYRATIANFSISEIGRISGKPINGAVKTAIDNAKKATKAGTMKAGEGKIGTIDGHLYLRIKDGSSHEDDFLIVKNYTVPGVGPVRDGAYLRKVADYIQIRTDAFNKLATGEKAIKTILGQLTRILEMVEGNTEEAKRGQYGMETPADRAAKHLKDAIGLGNDAQRTFDDEVHAPFSLHRDYAAPEGVDNADIAEYSRSFYLTKWRPKYGTALEYNKLCQTTIGQIRAEAKNARNFTQNANEANANYTSMIQEQLNLAQGEVRAMTEVWGLQKVDTVAPAVEKDILNLITMRKNTVLAEDERQTLIGRYLQTSNERMVQMANSHKRLQKHVTKMDEIVQKTKAIPKDQLKLAAVKDAVKGIAEANKAMASYVKDCGAHMKLALGSYAKMKKEAAIA